MKTLRICIVILVCTLALQGWAQPRPMSFSGDFEQGGVVRIYGQGFGNAPAEGLAAGLSGSLDEPTFGLIVGDNLLYEKCTVRRKLSLRLWNDRQIDAEMNFAGLESDEDFYFFVVDLDGLVSYPAGPWNLEGPIPANDKVLAVEENKGRLAPLTRQEGIPYISSWGPGSVDQPPTLSLYGRNFDEQVGDDLEDSQQPRLLMGDSQNLDDCSWLVQVPTQEWADDHIFFQLILPEFLEGNIVFFFVEDLSNYSSNGYPLVLSERDMNRERQDGTQVGGIQLLPGRPTSTTLFSGN